MNEFLTKFWDEYVRYAVKREDFAFPMQFSKWMKTYYNIDVELNYNNPPGSRFVLLDTPNNTIEILKINSNANK